MSEAHLHDELASNPARVIVPTRYGNVTGGRASNGAAVFLGMLDALSCIQIPASTLLTFVRSSEVPYALPPLRFADGEPLPDHHQYPPDKEYITESSCKWTLCSADLSSIQSTRLLPAR